MRRWYSIRACQSDRAQDKKLPASTNAIGMLLFMVGVVFLTLMDASVKWMIEDRVHVIQLLFARSCIIALLMVLFYAARKQLSQLKPNRKIAQGIRGLIGFIAPFTFFLSLKYLPLTAATVVFFSNIFIITLASAVFLKEQVGVYRWSAVAIGYVGVFIAIQPDAEGELFGYLLVLLSSATYAFLFISGKKLGTTESSASLVLCYNLGVGVVALFWLAGTWITLTPSDYMGLLLVSVLAVIGQYCATQAFAMAEASLLAPLNYTSLVITLSLDWVLWHVIPGIQTMLGAAIIVASSVVVIYRQNTKA